MPDGAANIHLARTQLLLTRITNTRGVLIKLVLVTNARCGSPAVCMMNKEFPSVSFFF